MNSYMYCPDCKTPMTWSGEMMDKNGEIVMRDKLLWKCPKCKIEVEDEDEDE